MISQRVTLREYEWSPSLVLPPGDLAMLSTELRSQIGVMPGDVPGTVKLFPGSFVGVVRLPSGITLDLLPKVPLFTVMWMMAEVERLGTIDFDFLERNVPISTFEDILEPIARIFADHIEHLIDRGLYRAYVEQEDNLTAIRGRIDFREDLNRNVVLRHRTYCRFTEFSWDVPENQVIRQVVRQLSSWGFSRDLTGRLMSLDRQMDDVRRTHMSAGDIDRFHYSRQSEHYRVIHRFCRLFLAGFSLSEQAGSSLFDGFVLDMNALFERFIGLKLDAHLPAHGSAWTLNRQRTSSLDSGGNVQIRPDLLLEFGGHPVLVADTKYKQMGTGDHKRDDLYQMIAYCTALELTSGVLIYPRHTVDIQQRLRIRGSGIQIEEVSIDLGDARDAIEAGLSALAKRMVAEGLAGVAIS